MTTNWASELNKLTSRPPTLEHVFTSPDFFGVVEATPLQRAVCRAIEGRPLGELENHPAIIRCIGTWTHRKRPKEVVLAAGIRCGKSLLNAAICAWLALTVDLAKTRVRADKGEIPRISIVSTQKDTAQATLSHLIGTFEKSPQLRKCVVKNKTGYIFTQPHTGHQIEITVVANKKSGASLVARWQVAVIFDEAARIPSAGTSTINLEESRAGALARIVEGGLMLMTSSPTVPTGKFYELVTENLYRNNPNVLSIQAPGRCLNPVYWTPEREQELKERDPDTWLTDSEGQFASPANSLFPLNSLDASIRKQPTVLPPEPGLSYIAAMDPGLSGNSWTLVVGTRQGNKRRVVMAREWTGTKLRPNNAEEILREISILLEPYGVTNVATDQYGFELLRQTGTKFGLTLFQRKYTHEEKQALYVNIQNLLTSGLIEIPDNQMLKLDLLRTKKVPLQSGGYTIQLPQTSDGRHCDFVPSFLLAIGDYCQDVYTPAPKRSYAETLEKAIERDVDKRVRKSIRDKNKASNLGRLGMVHGVRANRNRGSIF